MKRKENGAGKYFELTRSELNGLLVLVGIIIVVYAIPSVYKLVTAEDSRFHEERLTYDDSTGIGGNKERVGRLLSKKIKAGKPMFRFDPNTVSIDGWQQLGLSAKQAQAIVNYRRHGGRFYKAEDLKKMYTITPELCARMLPYVAIAKPENPGLTKVISNAPGYKKTTQPLVDINSADSTALDALRGIGGSFARRIITYRNKLGGFHSLSQLLEVYGLDSAKFNELLPQVTVAGGVKKININTATFDDLKSHPYLRYKEINAILQYRKQHGNFSTPDDLGKTLLIGEATIQKITPYLTF